MARIEGVNLPEKKRVEYGLTYIYGIGLISSQNILNKLKISLDKRVKDLTNEDIAAIQTEISSYYKTEGSLRREVALNIKNLQQIGSYRGDRHKKGLPVHGQRTKTNARTRKGPRRATIPGKKQPKK